MKLCYTPRSHFSRKVRILLDAWGIAVDLIDAGNVAESNADAFADNPLLRVPALVDEDTWIVDSDHIARYLTVRHDPDDRFSVLADDVNTLNLRAIMNGVMANEVEVILAQRTGIDIGAHQRFAKLTQAIVNGLDWLEANASQIPNRPCYAYQPSLLLSF